MKKHFAIFSFIVLVVYLLCNTTVFADNLAGFIKIPANGSIEEFYIGQYPVTNSEYKSFIDSTGSKAPNYWKGGTYPNGKSNHPVIFVSYNDALAYCKWLEKKYPNYSFRLPTVSEWEYAASGGRGYAFPWGNQMNENNFNYNKLVASVYLKQNPTVTYINQKSTSYGQSMPLNKVISINPNGGINGWIDHRKYTGFVYTDLFKKLMDNGGYTTPVNQYPSGKSPFGVYDMSGNVWEWTSSQITATNGAEKGQTVYAIKGGSWYANANSCRITMQGEGRRPNTGYNTVGFRVVAVNKSNSTSYNTENNNTEMQKKRAERGDRGPKGPRGKRGERGPKGPRGDRGERPGMPEQFKKFDADQDGKLSEEERKAAHEAMEQKMLERFDADKDGKLSDEEKAAMKAEMQKMRRERGDRGPKGPRHGRGNRGPKGPRGAEQPAVEAPEAQPEA